MSSRAYKQRVKKIQAQCRQTKRATNKVVTWTQQLQQVVAEAGQEQESLESGMEQVVAPKRRYRPHILRPSAIRRICHMPAEKCDATTEAKVMYHNANFGKCTLDVCHEDLCPYTETCKKHKGKSQPKASIAMRKMKSRIVKAKLNSRVTSRPTKGSSKSPKNPVQTQ